MTRRFRKPRGRPLRRLLMLALAGGALAAAGFGVLLVLASQDVRAPWDLAAPAPEPRFESPAAVVDGSIHVFGGFNDEGHDDDGLHAIARVDRYDPARDRWERLGDAPRALTHIYPAADGPVVWIAGGLVGDHPGPATDEVWRYDTRTDTWSAGPSLPEAVGGGGMVIRERSLHYFGGYYAAESPEASAAHWVLDLDDEAAGWRTRAPLPQTRGHMGAAVLDGLVYAVGGAPLHHPQPDDVASVVRYDPGRDAWERVADLPSPRSHFEPGTFVFDGRIVIVGGRDNRARALWESAMTDILAYDPDADRWSALPGLPVALRAPVAAVVGGRLVVTLGSTLGANHPQRATWVAPCLAELTSTCRPDGWTALRAGTSLRSRSLLKTLATLTPVRLQAHVWEPLRSLVLPMARPPEPQVATVLLP